MDERLRTEPASSHGATQLYSLRWRGGGRREPEGGKHTLTFRNREHGVGDDFAGLVAVVVTNDANLDPVELYDPYP